MKKDGVEAIEIESNIGGVTKRVALTGESRKNIAEIIANEALSSIGKGEETMPKSKMASTATELQPQVLTCPYCISQDIDCVSSEKVTSQLTLFNVGLAVTEKKIRSNDKFICVCGATAKLSWKEAKKEENEREV